MQKNVLHAMAVVVVMLVSLTLACNHSTSENKLGPLRPHNANPRYFSDPSGDVEYLTGSHTWSNLQDFGKTDSPEPFDFDSYLNFLIRYNHNFIRLWRWELSVFDVGTGLFYVNPHPWPRVGPAKALDGKPAFDLMTFNQSYFNRLRERVIAAGEREIYVSIMLFEGWGIQTSNAPWCWDGHPFNKANNVNGIDGDADDDGRGIEIQTLADPAVTALQEAYVRKVIDTVNDLDNVLYEIVNESGGYSTEWQYHFIRFVKDYESGKPKQHPVGMTFQYSRDTAVRGKNETLFASPADWISPNPDGGWRDDPPDSSGVKIVINDTDHLWGIGGNRAWVWKSFCRGLNPIFMDRYGYFVPPDSTRKTQWVDFIEPVPAVDPKFESVRLNLGHTRSYARRMNLADCVPCPKLASTGFCLANIGVEYLVYAPDGGSFTVDLGDIETSYVTEWFDPETGTEQPGQIVRGGEIRSFSVPFDNDAVLYLKMNDGR